MDELSFKEAYLAMYYFLETYNSRGSSDEIEIILSSMSLLSDDVPADAGVWDDWLKAIEKVKKQEVNASLHLTR